MCASSSAALEPQFDWGGSRDQQSKWRTREARRERQDQEAIRNRPRRRRLMRMADRAVPLGRRDGRLHRRQLQSADLGPRTEHPQLNAERHAFAADRSLEGGGGGPTSYSAAVATKRIHGDPEEHFKTAPRGSDQRHIACIFRSSHLTALTLCSEPLPEMECPETPESRRGGRTDGGSSPVFISRGLTRR